MSSPAVSVSSTAMPNKNPKFGKHDVVNGTNPSGVTVRVQVTQKPEWDEEKSYYEYDVQELGISGIGKAYKLLEKDMSEVLDEPSSSDKPKSWFGERMEWRNHEGHAIPVKINDVGEWFEDRQDWIFEIMIIATGETWKATEKELFGDEERDDDFFDRLTYGEI